MAVRLCSTIAEVKQPSHIGWVTINLQSGDPPCFGKTVHLQHQKELLFIQRTVNSMSRYTLAV
jgi:hypothetical protein